MLTEDEESETACGCILIIVLYVVAVWAMFVWAVGFRMGWW
jgi:hypothetical protein